MFKKEYVSFVISIVILSLIVGYSVLAEWQSAPPFPPEGNVDVPLNVGPDPQIKSAGLQLESLIVTGSVNIGGNIIASNNTWDSCRDLAMDCIDEYSCNNGEFITRVTRHTNQALCDAGGGNFYYRMSARCCKI